MKNEKLSRLFLRFTGGGPVGYTQAMPGQLPEYQTGADLNGVDMKTMQEFEHYYGGKYPILAEGGDTDAEDDDQSFYTNRVNTFIKTIQETAQKNLLKEVMRESQGENEEREYTDEEMVQAGYGMNVNQRPDYGSSLYDAGNLEMFAKNKIGDVKNAFKDFGQRTALIDREAAYNKKNGIPDTYTDIKSKFSTGMADIFKQKNPVYENYTYGEMGYGGGLNKYVGDENSSTTTIGNGPDMLLNGDPSKAKEAKEAYANATANNTGTGVTKDDKQNGFRTQMINGKLYAIGPDGRMFEAAEAKKEEEGTRFDYRNRNRLTKDFAQAMQKGTYLDTKLLGPPIIEEKGFGPFKRNITTWQYGKLSGDPYATNNNGTAPGSTTVPGSTTQKKTTGPQPDPNDPRIVSPGVKAAEDYTFRSGQDTDYFPPSGGWQDYPGNMQIDQAGPRDTDGNPAAGPFQSQYIPGSPEYPNPTRVGIPGVPDASNVGPGPTVLSQSQPQTQPNVDPSGNQLPPGYTWDPTLNAVVSTTAANAAATASAAKGNNRVVAPSAPSYNTPAYDANRSFGQVSDNEKKYFSTEGDMSNPDWRSQKIDNYGSKLYDTPGKVAGSWNNIKGKPVNSKYAPKGSTKDEVLKQYDKLPAALKDIATDHLFNASSDPRIFTLAAAGAIDINESRKYKTDPKLLEDAWAKNIDLINQQYNDDPQAFTSSVSDYRKLIYRKSRQDNPDPNGPAIDTESTTGMPGLQYNAWAGRTGNTQNYIDQTYFNPANGYRAPQYFQKQGGTIIPMFAPGGPFSFTDMAEEEEEGIIYDPTTGKPLEFPSSAPMTDQQRIDVLDKGTEYDKSDDPNTWFVENPFNVKQKSKTKKKPSFNKMMRNMSAATAFFNQDERVANARKLSEASQASNVFNDAPSFYGNDIINSGKRMIGDGSGIPVFNTGYAQMGGSMLDSMKEGDEVYLTEEQINDILKRGGKLSYL